MRLAGKVALITGAGSGIGRASAIRFAAEGARVAVVDVDAAGGEATCQEIAASGGAATFIRGDVTDAASVHDAFAAAVTFGGADRLDISFHNAGIGSVGNVEETSLAEFERVMSVNVRGVFLCCQEAVAWMKPHGRGSIINMSSCIATMGLGRRAAYSASKGAVLALTKSMQVDYAACGIRVNALMPGTIHTPFVEGYLRRSFADRQEEALANIRARQLTGELGRAEDVAWAALYLASDESRFVMGAGIAVDGGLTAGKA